MGGEALTVGYLRKVTLAGVVAAALAASGPPAAATASLKTAVITSAGISVRYPSAWTTLPRDPKALALQQRRLAKRNPKLALNAEQQAAFLRAAKFRSVDLGAAAAGRFASNVNVQVDIQGGFPGSLQEFTSTARSQYEQQGVTVVSLSSLQVSGTTSYRADTRATVARPDGTTLAARVGQLFVPRNAGSAIITVATADDAAGAQLIDTILSSVRRV